jgi:hypothetical protein
MPTNKPDQNTHTLEGTLCRKCKGAGVIFTTDLCGTEAICCDLCSAGNRIWSRLLELSGGLGSTKSCTASTRNY